MKKLLFLVIVLMCVYGFAAADTLTIPAGTRIIEEEAFYGDTGLDTVVLPEGIVSISARAFAQSSITLVSLPSTLKQVGADAFPPPEQMQVRVDIGTYAYNWAEDNGYIIQENQPVIEDYNIEANLFSYIDIDDSTTAVYGYRGTNAVVIVPDTSPGGKTVVEIYACAFYNKKNLDQFYLPPTIKKINNSAFSFCSVREVFLSNGLESIGDGAFRNSNLEQITVPASVQAIGDSAFYGCNQLTRVTLKNGLRTIERLAFSNCESLKELDIPGTVEILNPMYASETTNQYARLYVEKLTLHEGLQEIKDYALLYNDRLTSITIPQSVKKMGRMAFSHCTALETAVIGAAEVGINAFSKCTNLKNVSFLNTVRTVCEGAFIDDMLLEEISLNAGIDNIENGFRKCGVKSVFIPASVTNMGYAFYECPFLETVVFEEGLTKISNSAFCNCTALTQVQFPETLRTIEGSAFSYCSSLTEVLLPDSVTSMSEAFRWLSALQTIRLPSGLTEFGNHEFSHCADGVRIYWPGNLKVASKYRHTDPFYEADVSTFTICGPSDSRADYYAGLYHCAFEPTDIPSINRPRFSVEGIIVSALQSHTETLISIPVTISAPEEQDNSIEGPIYATDPYIYLDVPDCVSYEIAPTDSHQMGYTLNGRKAVMLPELSGRYGSTTVVLKLTYNKLKDKEHHGFTPTITIQGSCKENYPAQSNTTRVFFAKEYGYIVISDHIAKQTFGDKIKSTTINLVKPLFEQSHYIIQYADSADLLGLRGILSYDLPNLVSSYDEVYIYIFAHGMEDENGNSAGSLRMGGYGNVNIDCIEYDDLVNGLLGQLQCKVTLVLDSCFGGLAADANNSPNVTVVSSARSNERALARWINPANVITYIPTWIAASNEMAYPEFTKRMNEVASDRSNYTDNHMTLVRLLDRIGIVDNINGTESATPTFKGDMYTVMFTIDEE